MGSIEEPSSGQLPGTGRASLTAVLYGTPYSLARASTLVRRMYRWLFARQGSRHERRRSRHSRGAMAHGTVSLNSVLIKSPLTMWYAFLRFLFNNWLVLAVLALGVQLARFYIAQGNRDLGLNIATELFGVALTVFIIDRFYKARDQERLRGLEYPKRVAMYQQAKKYLRMYTMYWYHIGQAQNGNYDFGTLNLNWNFIGHTNVFKGDRMDAILGQLDINAQMNHHDPLTYGEFIEHHSKALKDYGEHFLTRYADQIDPQLYTMVEELNDSPFLSTQLDIIRRSRIYDKMVKGTRKYTLDQSDWVMKQHGRAHTYTRRRLEELDWWIRGQSLEIGKVEKWVGHPEDGERERMRRKK